MINDSVNQRHMADNPGASARMTTQSLPPGLAAKTAERTSLGHRFQRALAGGPNLRFLGLHSPPGGGSAAASLLLKKRLTLPFLALLAVLTAGLLFLLSGGLLNAQSADPIEHPENSADPVATYTGIDPEERLVYWSLLLPDTAADLNNDGDMTDTGETATDNPSPDHGVFMISSDGVLTFRSPPNYEMPTSATTSEELPVRNVYNVVVVASDDAPGAALDGANEDIREMAYHKVTVTVTDVDDDGMVTISAQQPQQGVALNTAGTPDDADDDADAALKDQDASPDQITAAKWKWEQSSAMDGPWTLISGAAAASYTPAMDVVGMYLRVTATYTDRHGDDKTAMAVSAHMVRAKPAGENASPVFPGDPPTDREVDENSLPGTAVGKPVTAGDAGDILTYSLSGTDGDYFAIDRATGQITVKKKLNFEADVNANCAAGAGSACVVIVTATDPWGIALSDATASAATRVVNIAVKPVNEAPMITTGPTRDSKAENFDSDADTNGRQLVVATYVVADNDVADTIVTLNWSLTGPDAADFKIEKNTDNNAELSFKEAPNFEMPADATMDNMYMVTVVATDAKKLTAMRDVVITVDNANDDGTITLSSVQPKVGIPFTADLSDEDGVMGDVKWQWASADRQGVSDCPDAAAPNGVWTNIAKAKSDTYKPVATDATGTKCLQATASYTDNHGSDTAMEVSGNAVVVNEENRAPEFKLNDKVITATTRIVAENTVAISTDNDTTDDTTDNIGMPVTATDLSGSTADTLTYTLDGRDAAMFRVRQDDPATTDANEGGQIEVAADTDLDYETKKSYTVTVTATDPSLVSATIDVTINVTDVNEPPEIAGEDDLTKEFRENSTSTIETFRATDPEKRPVYWSLKANDSGYRDDTFFTISSRGALSFKEGRDFEAAADDGTDNTYKVIVIASDDAPNIGADTYTDTAKMSERKFTVRVTHISETGSITVNRLFPQMGVPVEATLMDGDATSVQIGTAVTWQWYMGSTEIDGATDRSHTPTATGSLRVEATYTAKGDTRVASKSITVRAGPTGTNANADPSFENATEARSVDEGKANANVGAPIRATDDTPGDSGRLTYTLSGADAGSFTITTSGQLKTKVALDHETNETLTVTVTATDPSDGDDEVIVTVTINDVNEAPMIVMGPTRALSKPENTPTTSVVAVYTANDLDDGAALVWSLTGPDASDFNIGNQLDGDPGQLTFKESPDYEMPAASNNLYRVTVEVSDGKLKATRPMTVMVTDEEEEGKVTLSSVQPKVAIDLTASLKDSDGDVENIEWQWARTETGIEGTPVADCSGVDAENWAEIDGADMATYTPDDDDDLYNCLQATASYTDRRGDGKTAMQESDNAVIENTDNRAPMFKENDQEITETTRKVVEGTAAGMNIGDGMIEAGETADMEPVMATDPNGDKLTYTLGGMDMASFGIEPGTGQLMTKAKLDYEAKKTYMVTVTATDPNGEMASVDVTIMVTDVDEAPEIIVGGLVVRGTGAPDYAENGMGMVATYSAAGPDADMASWSLSGADEGDFEISSAGVLTFMDSPNYESPADANTDNIYMVMVNANDGTNDAMKTVSVRVTNEDDPGRVTFWRDGADATSAEIVVGDELGGAVDDSDGNPGDTLPIEMYTRIAAANITSWQWAKSMTPDMMDSWMDIGTGGMYTVMGDDDGYYLRATAMYDDGEGMGKTASEKTMMVTMNAAPMFDSDTATREVAENTAAGMSIGAPVTATDADDEMLTYTLTGADAASFDIGSATGQLMTKEALDYEMPRGAEMSDSNTNDYMVMVTATDPEGASDMITVTITVTDVDEMVTGDDLVDRYDADDSGDINKAEVLKAINDYLFDEGDEAISRSDVLRLITLYLFSG